MEQHSFWITLLAFLVIAFLIHQKMIDWGSSYTRDGSALDELSFREVIVQDIMANIFICVVILCLYMLIIKINPFLFDYWQGMCDYFTTHFKSR